MTRSMMSPEKMEARMYALEAQLRAERRKIDELRELVSQVEDFTAHQCGKHVDNWCCELISGAPGLPETKDRKCTCGLWELEKKIQAATEET